MLNKKIKFVILIFSLVVTFFIGCSRRVMSDVPSQVSVFLEGGSGKTKIQSPAQVSVENGNIFLTVIFQSPNYDYVIVDEKKILNQAESGNSTFKIPVKNLQDSISIIADTTAMSVPHEINYTINFNSIKKANGNDEKKSTESGFDIGLEKTGSINFQYAEQIKIDCYDDLRLIDINGTQYLVVPENCTVPKYLPKKITVLQKPLDKTYLVSTSVMDFFSKLNIIKNLKFCSLKKSDWFIQDAIEAMDQKKIEYAGKYSAPDYEKLVSGKCNLALENTMVLHVPEVKEKLEELGIPVLIERSTYESNPLGRLEWIKLYGVLFDKEDDAQDFFQQQISKIEKIVNHKNENKSVVFFYLSSTGAVNVRRPNDYIAKMIELAGGNYFLKENSFVNESSSSTVNMQMENFYAAAVDSDILIYNGTIDDSVKSLTDLQKKDKVFFDFKAVKEKKTYYTEKKFFQETTGLADFILDLNKVLSGNENGLIYLRKM